jgi:enterochelin esterase-like enzyme
VLTISTLPRPFPQQLLVMLLCLLALAASGCQFDQLSPGSTILPGTPTVAPASPSGYATSAPLPKPEDSPTAAAVSTQTPELAPPLTPTPDPEPTCQETEGRFELGQLPTPLLRDLLDFRVFLPPCYGADPGQRYPVLYLIHGQSYNDDQWERLGAGRVASELILRGEIAPFLIVMPRDRLWSQPTEDNFGKAVLEVLVPYIDETYATFPDRAYRAVGGLSRGAGWAVHLGLSAWETFGSIGGHSLPVFWTDTYHIKNWLSSIPEDQMPRIYLDIGEKDRPEIMVSARWFEELLTARNIAHEWYLFSGYHEEKYWEGNLERYLRWYAGPWKTE